MKSVLNLIVRDLDYKLHFYSKFLVKCLGIILYAVIVINASVWAGYLLQIVCAVMQTNRTVFAPLDFSKMNWALLYSGRTAYLSGLTIMNLYNWIS